MGDLQSTPHQWPPPTKSSVHSSRQSGYDPTVKETNGCGTPSLSPEAHEVNLVQLLLLTAVAAVQLHQHHHRHLSASLSSSSSLLPPIWPRLPPTPALFCPAAFSSHVCAYGPSEGFYRWTQTAQKPFFFFLNLFFIFKQAVTTKRINITVDWFPPDYAYKFPMCVAFYDWLKCVTRTGIGDGRWWLNRNVSGQEKMCMNIMQRDAADFQLISARVDNISSNKVCVHIFNELSHGDIAMNACNSGKITRDVSWYHPKCNDLQHAWEDNIKGSAICFLEEL